MLEGYDELLGTQLSLNGVNGVLVAFVRDISYKLKLRDGQHIVIPVADAIKAKKLALDGLKMKLSNGRECKLACLDEPSLPYALGMVTVTWLDNFAIERIPLLNVLRNQRDAYIGLKMYKKYDQEESYLVTVAQALVRHGEKYYKLAFEDGDYEYTSKFDLIDEIELQLPLERVVRVEDIATFDSMRPTVVGDAGHVTKLPTMTNVRFWGKSIYVALGQDGDHVVVNDLLDTEHGVPGEAKSTNAIEKADILVAINGVSVVGEYVESIARKINSLPRPIVLSFSKPEQLPGASENATQSDEAVADAPKPTTPKSPQHEGSSQTASEVEVIDTPESPLAPTEEPPKPAPQLPKAPKVPASNAISAPGQSLLSKSQQNKSKARAKTPKPTPPRDDPVPEQSTTTQAAPKQARKKKSKAADTSDLDGISSESDSEPLRSRVLKRKVVPARRAASTKHTTKEITKDSDSSESIDSDDAIVSIKNKKQRPAASPAKVPLALEHSFLKSNNQPGRKPQSKQPKPKPNTNQKVVEDFVEKRGARNKRIHIQLDAPTLQLSLVNTNSCEYPIVNGFLKGSDGKTIGQIEADGRVRMGALLMSANGKSLRGMPSTAVASFLKQAPRPLALSFVNNP